ncbi:histidinol-phosphatase HisJ family protein [candidate division KSB3 bacterium]|uniref:Histidinol-phosphatase n=1 Tax=candidate division KSB3 bacterium TaxID=2044937 RepID=A0A9D5JTL0_9BACT|nr:histidinol-phosphatase HisJ family protein [candidate division KSB3 bacterium]MBD3323411.1 histidinol-phosphatase HisJ family protein [candidate division KSB3 bacterium]
MVDYHIHTKLCGHASGEMSDYIVAALAQPLQEIGFADHLPMLKWAKPEYAMAFDQLPLYIKQVQRLQRLTPSLPIKLGIEADYYSPSEESATRDLLVRYPFDYVYGSVHLIDGWAIDDARNLARWKEVGVDTIYERYFAQLRLAAQSGLFDIMAHTDLAKKFQHKPTKDISGIIEETIRTYKASGVAVEINTSGMRKPAQEIYPAPNIIRLLKDYDIPIVFGSDAHRPEEIGKDFSLARTVAKACGHQEIVMFEHRQIVGTYRL